MSKINTILSDLHDMLCINFIPYFIVLVILYILESCYRDDFSYVKYLTQKSILEFSNTTGFNFFKVDKLSNSMTLLDTLRYKYVNFMVLMFLFF